MRTPMQIGSPLPVKIIPDHAHELLTDQQKEQAAQPAPTHYEPALEPVRFCACASPAPTPGDELSICYQTREIARIHRLFVACALDALAAQEVQAW
jgi:hypothetical protein